MSTPADSTSLRIQQLASLLLKESDQVLQEQLGIGMSQFRIMKIVQGNPRILQRQIADALNQTEASISRQVKLLHGKQLIATQLNPKDRREHITVLTPKGVRLTEAALNVLEAAEKTLLSGLSAKQHAELLATLTIIEHALP